MRELALHILDLVQNSIEAGAGIVKLDVVEDLREDTLLFRVTDNGRGMDAETVTKVLDPFVTSRKTRRVGLGLPLIDMSTKRCGGYLKINSRPGQGTVVEAVYQYSHWDRPPLGNMVDTLQSIIVANPDLDFSYSHTVGKACFLFRSREFIEVLGDVSLTHPDVLVWLREFLTANMANLYGGAQDENS